MNPAAGTEAMFRKEWLQVHRHSAGTLNVYIMCDPAARAGRRAATAPRSSSWASTPPATSTCSTATSTRWASPSAGRSSRTSSPHWSAAQPGVQLVKVGYERYGMRDAMEHFEERMEVEKVGFEIIELAWPPKAATPSTTASSGSSPTSAAASGSWLPPCVDADGTAGADRGNHRAARAARGRPGLPGDEAGAPQGRRRQIYSLNKLLLDEFVAYPYSKHDDGSTASRASTTWTRRRRSSSTVPDLARPFNSTG
jgi:hypothetical protein